MPTYSIDSTAQQLRATGIVEPVYTWVEDAATGRRRPSEVQDTDDHGVPLWAVEVSYIAETYGRFSTVVAKVTTAAPEAPTVSAFEVVAFHGLTVMVTANKAGGGLREAWRAQGIPAAGRRSRQDEAAA